MNRRCFIKSATGAAGSLVLGVYLSKPGALASEAVTEKSPIWEGYSPWLVVAVTPENRIIIKGFKQEIGQGSSTGAAMIFADELGADWDLVSIESGTYDSRRRAETAGKGWGDWVGGSSAIRYAWGPLREAGAAIREMLILAAARQWGIAALDCQIEKSFVIGPAGQRGALGEFATLASEIDVPQTVPLKPDSELKIIGKSYANLYQEKHVTGSLEYTINLDLPDMVHAAIARCPVFMGKVKSFDASKARSMPGVIDVFEIPEFDGGSFGNYARAGVAVVADSTWRAFKARDALEIEWDLGPNRDGSFDTIRKEIEEMDSGAMESIVDAGDVDALRNAEGLSLFEASYTSHLQEHGLMEPLGAVAHHHDDLMEVWAPIQFADRAAASVEQRTGIPQEKIIIHGRPAGGSFGRRYNCDYIHEVSFLAMKIDRPVKLTWTHEDGAQMGNYHPFTHFKMKAFLEDGKRPIGMNVDQFKMTSERWWGFSNKYDVPNFRVRGARLRRIVDLGPWRSVAEHLNTFSLECFIDELAHFSGIDPMDYREMYMKNPAAEEDANWGLLVGRAMRVLREVRVLSEWDSVTLPEGKGRGVAIGRFNNTLVAEVVTVDTRGGKLVVEKVDCVSDSGKILNPQMASGQLEGGILWGLTAVIHGGIEVRDGRVVESNYHDRPLMRFDESPHMNIRMLESDGEVGGFGESVVPAAGPALLNAYYDATGKRIRSIPMKWDEVI